MMDIDPLGKLLRDVDAAEPLRLGADDLVARVRRRARRGRAARSLVAAALLVVIGGAWFWHASSPAAPSKVRMLARSPTTTNTMMTAPVDVAELQRELARLNAEAELHERTALLILAKEQAAVAPVVTAPDASQTLTAQLERSALTLVNRGDSLLHDPGAKTEAAESFKRVLELFPQSQAAALARDRLNQIGA
jgi:hypothetical protein